MLDCNLENICCLLVFRSWKLNVKVENIIRSEEGFGVFDNTHEEGDAAGRSSDGFISLLGEAVGVISARGTVSC